MYIQDLTRLRTDRAKICRPIVLQIEASIGFILKQVLQMVLGLMGVMNSTQIDLYDLYNLWGVSGLVELRCYPRASTIS